MRALHPKQALALFAMIGFATLLVYAAIALRMPLLTTVTTVKRNLNEMPSSEWSLGFLIVGVMILVFGGYVLGGLLLNRAWQQRGMWVVLLGFPITFALLLLFTFPITSTDVYDYIFRGWMLAHYHTNPFVAPPLLFANDPLFPYVAWPWAVSAYGPLWERMSWAAAWIFGVQAGPATPDIVLLRLVLGYKILSLLGFVLCGAAIYAALGSSEPRWRRVGVYCWLWNPLVLWETVGAAHNDVWMALMLVLAIWSLRVWRKGQSDFAQRVAPAAALVALTAGGLIKFIAFFLGPVVLAAILRSTMGVRNRIRLVVSSGVACLVLATVAYLPFWVGLDTLRNIGDRRGLYTSTWLASLHPLLANAVGGEQANTTVSLLSIGLLLAGMAYATWQAWQRPAQVEAAMFGLLLWFLLVCNPWFQPWYLVWLVALLALLPWWRRMRWVIGIFCVTSMLNYIFNGLLVPALHFDQPPALRELVVSLFLYLPPLVALFWRRAVREPAAGGAGEHEVRPYTVHGANQSL